MIHILIYFKIFILCWFKIYMNKVLNDFGLICEILHIWYVSNELSIQRWVLRKHYSFENYRII